MEQENGQPRDSLLSHPQVKFSRTILLTFPCNHLRLDFLLISSLVTGSFDLLLRSTISLCQFQAPPSPSHGIYRPDTCSQLPRYFTSTSIFLPIFQEIIITSNHE